MPGPSDHELRRATASASDAQAAIDAIASLAQVCTRCRLHLHRTHAVPGEGPSDARLMLIGEAPGRTEDRTGRPFQGAAGRFLDQVLAEYGIDRARLFVTSVNKCRPPRNRPPMRDEREACRVLLDGQLSAVSPPVVLAMGRVAAGAMVPDTPRSATLAQLREAAPYAGDGRQLFVTSHPAAAMRFPAQREPFRADLWAACEAAGLP